MPAPHARLICHLLLPFPPPPSTPASRAPSSAPASARMPAQEFGLQDLLLLEPLRPTRPSEGAPPTGSPALGTPQSDSVEGPKAEICLPSCIPDTPGLGPQAGREAAAGEEAPADEEGSKASTVGGGEASLSHGSVQEGEGWMERAGAGPGAPNGAAAATGAGAGPGSSLFSQRWVSSGSSLFSQLSEAREMRLSANALEQLEVLGNGVDGAARGSLWGLMNRTLTPFGARLLRHWVSLTQPGLRAKAQGGHETQARA